MKLRELAESDLSDTLEDKNGAGSSFTIIDPNGNEFCITGTMGDIGFLLDNETGMPVQGRTITAAYRIKTLAEKIGLAPGRGWKVKTKGLDGVEYILHVVNYEPDRTIGIGRIKLAVD